MLVLVNVELEMVRHATVVFQRLCAVWLFVEAGHRNVTDFQQFRGGKENQVGGVMVKRVHHAAFFNQQGIEAAQFQLDSAGKPGGSSPDHQRIERRHNLPSTSA